MGGLNQALAQLRGIWTRLDGAQRTTVGAVLFATVLALVALVWASSRPDYRLLHRADSREELDRAVVALADAGIEVRTEGHSIEVDNADYAAALGALDKADVQPDTLRDDLDLLSSVTMGREELRYARHGVKVRNAERAIMALAGVREASLAVPEDKPNAFVKSRERKRSATVTVRLDPGADRGRLGQVISSKVASEFQLSSEHVEVWDTSGRIDDAGHAGSAKKDIHARSAELSMEQTRILQTYLDSIYVGKVRATVTVVLDEKLVESSEKIQPQFPAITSEEITERTPGRTVATGTEPSGPPVSTPARDTTRKTESTPFSGERHTRQIDQPIKRITAALVIDASLEDESANIRETAAAALAIDKERGDLVTVVTSEGLPSVVADAMPITQEPVEFGWSSLVPLIAPVAQAFVLGVVVLVLWWGLRGPRRRAKGTSASKDASTEITPQSGGTAEAARAEIEERIADDPASVSRMLERWLTEQKVS